jgi:hypothetical protein
MKRALYLTIIVFLAFNGVLCGQSFDWNIRGGLNMMNGQPSDKEIFLGYHAGVQAGVRVSYWGFYGEVVYSLHQNQDGGDPIGYFIPGIVIKRYLKTFLFVDFGGAFLVMTGDPELSELTLNPENTPVALVGLGTKVSKFELSLRTFAKQSYGVIQVTAAVKF